MKKFLLLAILLLAGVGAVFAQEGTYVVTKKAKEIPVYSYDNTILGYLHSGDKVFVTQFHQSLPQVDGTQSKPITTIDYNGQTGTLYLESDQWMRCVEKTAWDPSVEVQKGEVPGTGLLLLACAAYFVALLIVARPVNLIFWITRQNVLRPGRALLPALLLAAAISAEGYYFLRAENPFWFFRMKDVGLVGAAGGIVVAIVMAWVKIMVLSVVVGLLANAPQKNRVYFNYSLSACVTFVGTWLMLVVGNWSSDFRYYALAALGAGIVGCVLFCVRHVIRQRGLFLGLLVAVLIVAGFSTLCYVGLEIFRRVLEAVLVIAIIYYGFKWIGEGGPLVTGGGDEVIEYFDYESGKMRQLYKFGDSGYKDYSDGSMWGKTSDPRFFNKIG